MIRIQTECMNREQRAGFKSYIDFQQLQQLLKTYFWKPQRLSHAENVVRANSFPVGKNQSGPKTLSMSQGNPLKTNLTFTFLHPEKSTTSYFRGAAMQ